ncbi:MAG: hypothetical protein M1491_09580, partial [Deltaproteobacteria bacterium]|nr:hypothetical protein [Deltaproteobacteria bacterium]
SFLRQASPLSSPSARVFGVGTKISMSAYASESGFKDDMDCFMQTLRPYLSKTVPNIVVFPEHVGLPLAFSGSKAAQAITAQSVTSAMLDLFVSYSTSIDYYASRYPALSSEPARYIFLALTDTMWRPFYDTFSSLAKKYDSYIIACTDVSDVITSSTSPQDIQEFGSPGETSVYLPGNGNIYNTAFVFAPDGTIAGSIKKVNLVPEEYSLLNLTQGTLADVKAIPIPGTPVELGIAISLDAFTPSFLSWLAGLNVNVVVQPDANDGQWANDPNNWQPDGWLASTMGSIQPTYTTLAYDVNPMMTGNLFDVVFDGQSSITARSDARLSRAVNYIGNDPLTPAYESVYPAGGFLVLGPWVVPDPGITDTTLTLSKRRSILAQEGASLTQTGSSADRYISTIVWADIDVK